MVTSSPTPALNLGESSYWQVLKGREERKGNLLDFNLNVSAFKGTDSKIQSRDN